MFVVIVVTKTINKNKQNTLNSFEVETDSYAKINNKQKVENLEKKIKKK